MTHPPRNERPTWDVDDSRSIHNGDRVRELFDGHDAAAEHHSPEESLHLLRAELDACRGEIERLRRLGMEAHQRATNAEELVRELVAGGWVSAEDMKHWRNIAARGDEMALLLLELAGEDA